MKKGRTDKEIPAVRDYRTTVGRLGWCLVIMFGLMQTLWPALTFIGDSIFETSPTPTGFIISTFFNTLGYLLMFIIPGCLFYTFSKKKPPFAEPIRVTPRMPAYFPLLIFAGIAVILVTANVNAWFVQLLTVGAPEGTDPYAWMGGNSRVTAVGFAAMLCTDALAPAFAEEFMFRGVVYGNLRRYGRPAAMTVSALCFALMHQNAAQTFYTFMAGLVMALCYELTGSVWCGVFLHLFNNLYGNIAEYLQSVYGTGAYPMLQLIDTVLIALGLASMLGLTVILSRKNRKERAQATPGDLFGNLPDTLPDKPASHPDTRTAFKRLWAPGMTVYIVLALISVAATVLIIMVSPYLDMGDLTDIDFGDMADSQYIFRWWHP